MTILDTARAIIEAGKSATYGPWDTVPGTVFHVGSKHGFIAKACDFNKDGNAHFIAISRSSPEVAEALIKAVEMIEAYFAADDAWESAQPGVKALLAASHRDACEASMRAFLATLTADTKGTTWAPALLRSLCDHLDTARAERDQAIAIWASERKRTEAARDAAMARCGELQMELDGERSHSANLFRRITVLQADKDAWTTDGIGPYLAHAEWSKMQKERDAALAKCATVERERDLLMAGLERAGSWMSAAQDDPRACQEIKDDFSAALQAHWQVLQAQGGQDNVPTEKLPAALPPDGGL